MIWNDNELIKDILSTSDDQKFLIEKLIDNNKEIKEHMHDISYRINSSRKDDQSFAIVKEAVEHIEKILCIYMKEEERE